MGSFTTGGLGRSSTVSSYETSSTVPDLVGLSPSAAEETLEAAGLLMFEGEICAPSAAQNIGRIAWQGISPGTEVAPGSSVTVHRGQLTAAACPPSPPRCRTGPKLSSRGIAAHQRELPWRDTDDPYRALVSEVMLQTQAGRVAPSFVDFLKRNSTAE